MNRKQFPVMLVAAVVLLLCGQAESAISLRVMPPTPAFKPFVELLGRLSSVQQDFRDNADKTSMESITKLGYEINAGLCAAASHRASIWNLAVAIRLSPKRNSNTKTPLSKSPHAVAKILSVPL